MPEDRFNEYCERLLASYKRRNTETVTQRLESLCEFLRHKAPVVREFNQIAREQGLKAALSWRDGKFAQ